MAADISNIAKIIRVTAKLVHGAAPEWVRKGWFTCELPCADLTCGHMPYVVEPVLALGEKRQPGPMKLAEFAKLLPPQYIRGYSVREDIALQVLQVHNPKAAEWFYENGYPEKNRAFVFGNTEAEILEFYTYAELAALPRAA